MRRAQIRHGLDAEQLRRGRKRKSESGLRDWTEAEDVQLLKVVWSGARGLDRSIPTRGYETCKKRLQLIGKHVDRQWLSLHMGDATLTANVIAVLEDECFKAEVDAERATLRAAADAPTDLPAHDYCRPFARLECRDGLCHGLAVGARLRRGTGAGELAQLVFFSLCF